MAKKIARLRAEARDKWRWASGNPEERAETAVRDVAMVEPPVPKEQNKFSRYRA